MSGAAVRQGVQPLHAQPDTSWRSWGEGEPVVLLHGLPASSLLWRAAGPLMARGGVEALALDLPGFGATPEPEGYGLDGYGRWLAAFLMARFGDAPVHLVGHDFGGLVAAWACSAHPVRSLTLCSCPLDGLTWAGVRLTALPGLRLPFYGLFQGRLYLRSAVPPERADGPLAALLDAARADPRLGRKMQAIAEGLGPRHAARLRGQVGDTPTLCLWGAEDRVFSPASGRRTARSLRRARFEPVAGARHGLPLSHPHAFALAWRLHAFRPPRGPG